MNNIETSQNTTPLPDRTQAFIDEIVVMGDAPQSGLWCPNCGKALEAQKCKLFCRTAGCGYLVTCFGVVKIDDENRL